MAHTVKDDRYPMEGNEDSAGKEHLRGLLEKRKVNELWLSNTSKKEQMLPPLQSTGKYK